MLTNLSIKSRLTLIITFLSVLLTGIGSLGLFGMSQTNQGLQTVYVDRTIVLGQISNIDTALSGNRAALTNAVLFPTDENINRQLRTVADNTEKANKIWASYLDSYFTPEETALADRFYAVWNELAKEGFEPVVNHLRNRNVDETKKIIQTKFAALNAPFGDALAALNQIQLDIAKS